MPLIPPNVGLASGVIPRLIDAIIIDSPSVDSKKRVLCYAPADIHLAQIFMVLAGASASPSVTATLKYAPDVSLSGTEIITGGFVTTSATIGSTITSANFTHATVPQGNWFWLEVTAVSGTVPQYHISVMS